MASFGIIGMGKMGQAIEAVLVSQNQPQFTTFSRLNPQNQALLKACDVVIEFTTPEAAPGIIKQCILSQIPIVSGTTGWHESHLETIKNLCKQQHGKFLYASNFSIGMNITFAMNRKLAMIMNRFPQFRPTLLEKHHIHKKDKPSGTAYTLLEDIMDSSEKYNGFFLKENEHVPSADQIPVTVFREGEIKGYHEVSWNSGSEVITISHEARDRKIFAEGAIMAAQWLIAKPAGIYTMRDIIQV